MTVQSTVKPTLRVLSLGAGVQSSVMALMAAHGEIDRPNCAIFADTQWEPKGVYEHLDWLESVISNPLRVDHPFPVYRVTNGNIREDALRGRNTTGQKFSSMPLFTKGGAMGRRQCTREYKIDPIRKEIRRILGVKRGARVRHKVTQLIGISTDEAGRMKPSRDKWCKNTWPLIDADMSRVDCIRWFEKEYPGRVLAKSACIGCPFHNDKSWRDKKVNDPVSFADAVSFDAALRSGGDKGRFYEDVFLHRSLQPLDEVDFRNLEDMGQLNMFNNECEGMCGV